MLLLPITLSVMGIAVLVPDVPQLMRAFRHIPDHQYLIQGGVLTMPALCVALLSPLAGWIADRSGRRRLLIASMVVYALVGIAPTLLHNLIAIILSRVAVGICEAVVMTVSTTLISDYFQGHAREKWLANQTAVAALSALALIPLGGLLGRLYGWRGPFWVYLFSLLLAVGLWLYTWEPVAQPPFQATVHLPDGALEPAVLPWLRLGGICGITLFASMMFYTVQTQSALALASLGVHDAARIGVLTMIASLGVPLGTFAFRAASRLPIGTLLGLEFLLVGGGFLWMGKAATPAEFVPAAALNQIGCGMILPTLLTWATRGLAFSIRGRGTGIWNSTFAVGQFLSALVVTWLAGEVGGLLTAFFALGIAGTAAAALTTAVQLSTRSRLISSATDL
ncbi:MAG: MFS transporter [Pseudomonadota bacterium]|jgi:MFS family permease|nr:MFS transporter [Pseudomonadota bacterium]